LILGALMGKPLADRLGRKVAMIIVAAGFTVFAIAQGVAGDMCGWTSPAFSSA
jgi:MFS family permease